MSNRLPTVTSNIPRDLRLFTDRVREMLGNDLVSKSEVTRLIRDGGGGGDGGGGIENPFGVIAVPDAPTGLTAEGRVGAIELTWDAATYTGHSYAEVWAGDVDDIRYAVAVGMSPGVAFAHAVPPEVGKFYWVRFVNANLKQGPYNAQNGTYAKSKKGEEPFNYDSLFQELEDSLLTKLLSERLDWSIMDEVKADALANRELLEELRGEFGRINGAPQWVSTKKYATKDQVSHKGGLYVAKRAVGPSFNSPDIDVAAWQQIGSSAQLIAAIDDTNKATATLTSSVSEMDGVITRITNVLTYTGLAQINANGNIVNTWGSAALFSKVIASEKAVTSISGDITDLQNVLKRPDGTLIEARALSSLITEVSNARGEYSALVYKLNSIDAKIDKGPSLYASASAFNKLQTTVYDSDTGLAATASSVKALIITVNDLPKGETFAALQEKGVVWADSSSAGAVYTLKLRAKDSTGSAEVGFGMSAVKEHGKWVADVRFDCNRFALFDSANNLPAGRAKYPFIMKDGKVYIADLTVGTLNIESGAVSGVHQHFINISAVGGAPGTSSRLNTQVPVGVASVVLTVSLDVSMSGFANEPPAGGTVRIYSARSSSAIASFRIPAGVKETSVTRVAVDTLGFNFGGMTKGNMTVEYYITVTPNGGTSNASASGILLAQIAKR